MTLENDLDALEKMLGFVPQQVEYVEEEAKQEASFMFKAKQFITKLYRGKQKMETIKKDNSVRRISFGQAAPVIKQEELVAEPMYKTTNKKVKQQKTQRENQNEDRIKSGTDWNFFGNILGFFFNRTTLLILCLVNLNMYFVSGSTYFKDITILFGILYILSRLSILPKYLF